MEESRCVQNDSGEIGGKRPLERHRSRWEYNVQVYFKEIGLEAVD